MRILSILLFLVSTLAATHQTGAQPESLDYYLDQEKHQYDASVPKPDEVLGYVPGQWHIRHDQLVYYFEKLAAQSPRVKIYEYGRTYEQRRLLVAIITSEANHARLEEIKQRHLDIIDPAKDVAITDDDPVFVWLGHSIHGNESSGANSSVLTAYHYAAATSDEITNLLDETVIFVDPSINPDGLNRFASWANHHKSKLDVPDPNTREHNETWPGGRTNHYWFDLNRDWLPLTQPESQGRIAKLQEWKPNVLTDHHEMGTDATFHFSPGEPTRVHPLIPDKNQELTYKIAEYHAEAFDKRGALYYSAENFDDYYIGRGPTYLDFNGGVAILFEQASSRGFEQESANGILEFSYTILNQFTAAQSTVRGAHALREELLQYQKSYYKTALDKADSDPVKAYVFGDPKDANATRALAETTIRHGIEIYSLSKDMSANGYQFEAGKAFVVPLKQEQYHLIHGLFEKRTTFEDSLFYDISGWTFPLAFDLPYASLGSRQFTTDLLGDVFEPQPYPGSVEKESNYAYTFEWDDYLAPGALYAMLNKGLIAKVAMRSFTRTDGKTFNRGSIMLPVALQKLSSLELFEEMNAIASEFGIDIYDITSGYTDGTNLGSRNFETVSIPKIMIPVGEGITGYDVGEIWHLMDTRYKIPVSIVDYNNITMENIDRYNTIILVDGRYGNFPKEMGSLLKTWLQKGNTLIAYERALNWLKQQDLLSFEALPLRPEVEGVPYELYNRKSGARYVGGTIFEADIDATHPLLFGYNQSKLPIFKTNKIIYSKQKTSQAHPIMYGQNPLMSGYIHPTDLKALSGTPAVMLEGVGRGQIIAFNDNTNFRAYWYGTNKLLANGIFFAPLINKGTMR